MKLYLYAIAACLLLQLTPSKADAQLVEAFYFPDEESGKALETLHDDLDTALLSSISDSMFHQGNPNYVWVDLVRDRYAFRNYKKWYILEIHLYPNAKRTNKYIPENIQLQYVEKWRLFAKHIGQPLMDSIYSLDRIEGINYNDIINPSSAFRTIRKSQLRFLRLVATGELRLYNELLKDKLTGHNFPIDLEFDGKEFYVHGQKLKPELNTKYLRLLNEEFGMDENFSWREAPDVNNILGDRIEKLTANIDAVK